jgi:hypothetical protein
MPVEVMGHAGVASVHLHTDVRGSLPPIVKLTNKTDGREPIRLTLDDCVDLARLLIKTAAAQGWGSDDPDRQRIIAWAQVVHKN